VNVRHCTIAWAIDVAKDKHVEGHVGNVHVMKGSVTRMAAGIIVEHEPSPVRQIGVATRIWSGHARVALRTKRTAQRW